MDSEERNIIQRTQELTDELKIICSRFGLGGASSEYKIITEVFLYKFINDKFLYEIKQVDKPANEFAYPPDSTYIPTGIIY